MIRRRAIAAGLILAGALASELVTAGTAAAGGPGGTASGSAGCNGGGSCWTGVSRYIHLGGSGYTGQQGNTGMPVTEVPPPACWLQYFNTGPGGYAWWKSYSRSGDPNVAGGLGSAGYGQAFYNHRKDTSGAWYQAVENPSAPPGGIRCAEQLGPFRWVPAGTTPPLPPIPPRNLAMYAWAHMHLPAPSFTLNPQRRSYVRLPVFVTGLNNASGSRTVTASINTIAGAESETVTATAGGVTFVTPASGKYTRCGANGTRESRAQMNKAGAGSTPDCGVVYGQPSDGYPQGYPFQVAVTWNATARGNQGGNMVIATVTRTGPNPPRYIPVAEIQSVNNGG